MVHRFRYARSTAQYSPVQSITESVHHPQPAVVASAAIFPIAGAKVACHRVLGIFMPSVGNS
jgi:hypothetical protein